MEVCPLTTDKFWTELGKKRFELTSLAVCFNLDYKMESSTIVWKEQVSAADLNEGKHATNISFSCSVILQALMSQIFLYWNSSSPW